MSGVLVHPFCSTLSLAARSAATILSENSMVSGHTHMEQATHFCFLPFLDLLVPFPFMVCCSVSPIPSSSSFAVALAPFDVCFLAPEACLWPPRFGREVAAPLGATRAERSLQPLIEVAWCLCDQQAEQRQGGGGDSKEQSSGRKE